MAVLLRLKDQQKLNRREETRRRKLLCRLEIKIAETERKKNRKKNRKEKQKETERKTEKQKEKTESKKKEEKIGT